MTIYSRRKPRLRSQNRNRPLMIFQAICLAGFCFGGWLLRAAVLLGSPHRRRSAKEITAPAAVNTAAPNDNAVAAADAHHHAGKEKIHLVGSVPDMSANLKAKVAVSEEAQSDPRLLASVYDSMAASFKEKGLNLDAVAAMRQYFSNVDTAADPLNYTQFPAPLPLGAVRLCLVFFQKANPSLAELVHRASLEVISALPADAAVHVNNPEHYHITVYMPSQPHTLRPNPLVPGNSLPPDLTPEQLWDATRPSPAILALETEVLRREAAATSPPTFKVHRLLMADSGTLLLTSTDSSAVMSGLRRRLREAFPGGPPRQSTILHTSLARVLSLKQLNTEAVEKVQEVCDRWSDRLRGMEFAVDALHYVQETKFTTVEGPATRLPFKGRK